MEDDYEYEYIEEEVPQTAAAKKKCVFKEQALTNVKANLAKGRATRLANIKAKKEQMAKQKKEDDQYENYYVGNGGVSKEPEYEDDGYEYYDDSESEYEYYDEPANKPVKAAGKRKPAEKAMKEPKERKMTKKEQTLLQRMDKTEELLNRILQAQQGARAAPVQRQVRKKVKKPVQRSRKPVNQTVIQIPRSQAAPSQKKDDGLSQLMKLFN